MITSGNCGYLRAKHFTTEKNANAVCRICVDFPDPNAKFGAWGEIVSPSKNVRITVLGILLLALSVGGFDTMQSETPKPPIQVPITTTRATNPWSGWTASAEDEERSKTLGTVPLTELGIGGKSNATGASNWKPVESARWREDWILYKNEKTKTVVLNPRYFSHWKRADATGEIPKEGGVLGNLEPYGQSQIPLVDWETFSRLIVLSHLVITYWHTDSELHITKREIEDSSATVYFRGVHHYYTNTANRGNVAFALRLSKKGEIRILP